MAVVANLGPGSKRTQQATDLAIRLAAFEWLKRQTELHGEVLPWGLLLRGFDFAGTRVPLVSQQGIFKPKVLEEEDGPMLRHGLQALNGVLIQRPSRVEWRPSRDALALRLESFHAAR